MTRPFTPAGVMSGQFEQRPPLMMTQWPYGRIESSMLQDYAFIQPLLPGILFPWLQFEVVTSNYQRYGVPTRMHPVPIHGTRFLSMRSASIGQLSHQVVAIPREEAEVVLRAICGTAVAVENGSVIHFSLQKIELPSDAFRELEQSQGQQKVTVCGIVVRQQESQGGPAGAFVTWGRKHSPRPNTVDYVPRSVNSCAVDWVDEFCVALRRGDNPIPFVETEAPDESINQITKPGDS